MSMQNTGMRNATYDLISVIYHALQGAETYQQYIHDAEQSGDQELAQFFHAVQQEEVQRAQYAQGLLARRLQQQQRG